MVFTGSPLSSDAAPSSERRGSNAERVSDRPELAVELVGDPIHAHSMSPRGHRLVFMADGDYYASVIVIQGKLIDPRHVELAEAIPPGAESIQVQLVEPGESEASRIALLIQNPSFDFLRGEPDLYE